MSVIHRIYIEKLGGTDVGSFKGSAGDIFYDPTTLTLRISDGVTPGGRLLVGGTSTASTAGDITVTPSGSITTSTVQAALAELDAKKLALTGGTMTGDLILSSTAPTDPNAAVSKSFVETAITTTINSGGIAGDKVVFNNSTSTLTSNTVQSAIVELSTTKLDLTGGVLTGPLSTTQTTFGPNDLVSASYLQSVINTEDTYIDTAGFNSTDGNLSLVNTDGTVLNVMMDGRYLKMSGGTMTGPLIMNATSTDANAVATNSYVSTYVANTIATGGISGNNVVFNNATTTLSSNTVQAAVVELSLEKVDRAGDTMLGYLTLFADPTAPRHAATKDYVDAKVTAGGGAKLLDDLLDVNAAVPTDGSALVWDAGISRYILSNRVKTTGDTMTGLLTLSADPTANLHAATKQYVDGVATAAVAALIDSAPATLDTLNELAAALGDDPSFATTVTTAIAAKVAKAGDTMTGPLVLPADPTLALQAATKQYVDAASTAATTALAGKVAKTGDSMSGPLVLPADPTLALQAATKQYVDTTATAKVAKAGDTMTGLLVLSADPAVALGAATKQYVDTADATKVAKAGDTMTGLLVLSADPSAALGAATKQYVDTADATKVTKAGDTMTGLLTLSGAPTANLHAATKLYVDSRTLDDVSDVNTAGVTAGQVLSYDSGSSTWKPVSLPPGTTDTYTANSSVAANGLITYTKSDLSTYTTDISTAVVLKSGSTMTGLLTLSGAPTANLHAATKLYVDDKAALGVLKAGDTMTGLLTLSGAPTANLHAATKLYVDSILPDGVADGQELYWDGTQWIAQMATAMSLHGFTSDALAEAAMVATGVPMAGGRIYWNETTSKFRLYNGTAWSDVTPAASAGDVVGPASATDNAIVRFDTTTGKLIQNSTASLTDLGYLTTAGLVGTEFVRNAGYYLSDVVAITNPASIDIRTKSYMTMTVASAVTVGFTNTTTAGSVLSFTIEINMSSGSITWPSSVKWPGGTTPTFTVGKKHLVMFSTRDNGTTFYASALTDYA